MVIRHLDVVGIAILPAKAYAPLVIDANAVLSSPIPRQAFQPITRWNAQVVQAFSSINLHQLAP